MNVLMIGNSFSQDASRYLHDIARAGGQRIEVTNLYISGCSLERHYRNMLGNLRYYDLQCNGHVTGFRVSLEEALLCKHWDVISLQQVSSSSFDKESYIPYIYELAEYVRKCAPKAKLMIHQTWAYEDGSAKLTETAGYKTSGQMLADLREAYRQISLEIHADGIIPSGELFGALLSLGIPNLHRDTYHASLGLGRYALGLLWYRMLTGCDVKNNPFRDFDEPVPEEQVILVKKCVDSFPPVGA